MTERSLTLLVACLLLGCTTQYADPVLSASDTCAVWRTESDCAADTAHGCSVQPNDVGCRLNDPTCVPWQCGGTDPFVRRVGENLLLRDQPFRFVGADAWGVGWADGGCQYSGFANQQSALDRTFGDLSDMRVQVLRAWAFQSFAGASGTDYSSLDRVVQYARAAGVRLIFVLENMNTDCSEGTRDDSWFEGGYAQPYGGYALSLPDYARGLIAHFRDEPTVLAWEIMHEAGGKDAAAMLAFFSQMSELVRSEDANHLIILGTNNGDTPATTNVGSPPAYSQLQGLDTVDLIDVQDFSSPDDPVSASEQTDLGLSQALHKPCFIGASAISLDDTSASALSARATRFSSKIDGALDAGFAGFLVYAYTPNWQSPGLDFDGRQADPLAGPEGILAGFAARVRTH